MINSLFSSSGAVTDSELKEFVRIVFALLLGWLYKGFQFERTFVHSFSFCSQKMCKNKQMNIFTDPALSRLKGCWAPADILWVPYGTRVNFIASSFRKSCLHILRPKEKSGKRVGEAEPLFMNVAHVRVCQVTLVMSNSLRPYRL